MKTRWPAIGNLLHLCLCQCEYYMPRPWTDMAANSVKSKVHLFVKNIQFFHKRFVTVVNHVYPRGVDHWKSSVRDFEMKDFKIISSNSRFINTNSRFINTNSRFINTNSPFINKNSQFISSNSRFKYELPSYKYELRIYEYELSIYKYELSIYKHELRI